jgi:arginyl-tRNA synthetase
LAPAFAVAAGQAWSPSVRRSQHADFQADGALGLARRLGVAPRPLAEQVARQAKLDDLCSAVTVAGAGFINLTLADEVLGRRVAELVGDERLGVPGHQVGSRRLMGGSPPSALWRRSVL